MKNNLIASTGLAVALTLIVSLPAYSHGDGVIRLASNQVSVGGTIALTGEKLEKNADLRLELRGILDNYPAGRIRTDAKGTVSASITIPPAVPVGSYTLVAIAEDGDVTARTSLSVGPPAAVAAGEKGMPHMATDMPRMTGMKATAEMMKIEYRITTAEWAVIVAVILLSFTAGGLLLSRSRRTARR
jgi:hypothetical protein